MKYISKVSVTIQDKLINSLDPYLSGRIFNNFSGNIKFMDTARHEKACSFYSLGWLSEFERAYKRRLKDMHKDIIASTNYYGTITIKGDKK